jgi:hypothetical protein
MLFAILERKVHVSVFLLPEVYTKEVRKEYTYDLITLHKRG